MAGAIRNGAVEECLQTVVCGYNGAMGEGVRHAGVGDEVYGTRADVTRTGGFGGRFTPPPNPSRVLLRSAGLTGLASAIPPRNDRVRA